MKPLWASPHKSRTEVLMRPTRVLVELMIEYGVGVQARRTVRIVEIDEDFFT